MDFIDFIASFKKHRNQAIFQGSLPFYLLCANDIVTHFNFYALFIISNVMNCGRKIQESENGREGAKNQTL